MIVVSVLMLPVMIVRFYMGWFEMLLIDFPLIVASFWSISAFYVMAHRELFPKTWKRAFLFLPALMAAGVALTIINSRAVFEALIGYQTEFARTRQVRRSRRGSRFANDQVSPPQRLAALRGARGRQRVSWRLRSTRSSPTITWRCRFCCCSWAATTGPGSRRCGRSTRASSPLSDSASWPRTGPKRNPREMKAQDLVLVVVRIQAGEPTGFGNLRTSIFLSRSLPVRALATPQPGFEPTRFSSRYAQAEVLGERIKIPVIVEQVIPALDAPGGNHRIDGLANGHAGCP